MMGILKKPGRFGAGLLAGLWMILCLGACDRLFVPADEGQTEHLAVETPAESTLIEENQRQYYIFTSKDGRDYTRYLYEETEVTPEALIQAIEAKTGWHIALSALTVDGKGGFTVAFASESCIFGEVPGGLSEEFSFENQAEMMEAVTGSIKKTLQYYADPLSPENINVHFTAENGEAL